MFKNYFCLVLLVGIFCNLFFAQKINAQSISDPYEILLKSERIILSENVQTINLSEDHFPSEIIKGKIYRLVQFHTIPTAPLHRQIKDAGIELLDYIPNKAYLAHVPIELTSEELKNLNIRSIVKIKEDWKKSNAVRYQAYGDWAVNRNYVKLSVRYFENISSEEIKRYFSNKSITILKAPDYISIVHIQVPVERVEEIVNLPYISFVNQISDPGTPEDDLGRSLHRSNMIATDYPTGRHYDGSGVGILVRDDGPVGPHIDYKGRVTQANTGGGGTHGDGVAGVATGAGNLNPKFRGAATGANLHVINYEADFLDNTLELHLDEGVLLTNSSYSNGCNAGYTGTTETVDMQIHENPTLCHIFSAGNSNNNDCDYGAGDQWGNITGGHKQGKNVIATANLNPDATLVNSSSHGPAHDGRIKPDIAANGQDQMSTDPDNTYAPFGGTSGAAPCVMGTMAQLYQAYSELNSGQTPESALIKATILNTANDLGNEGPDFKYGWGHLNAYRAVKLLEDERYFDGMIAQDEFPQHTINIPDGTKQVRFMLYWMDEEGTQMAGPALINDLNLTVLDPAFTTLMPWVLDPTPNPATLDLPAGNGVDNLNNVEQVLINNPEGGDYNVFVNGFVVPNGAIKYYILYEVISENDITVIYPSGGEGLVPGEMERIHWDAIGEEGEFLVELSADNGATWEVISTVSGDTRLLDWMVPNFQTGQLQIRISRDGITDTSDANFSIGPVPQNLEINQACPDYIRLVWDTIPNTTEYDVYFLGEKYMEVIGSTAEQFYDVPITDPTADNWFSVRAKGQNDFTGRRAIAINHDAGLLSCMIDFDVANNLIQSPSAGTIITCEELTQEVIINIQNNGLDSVVGVDLYYQINNEPPVMEVYNNSITSFQDVTYTFATPLTLSQSGTYTLKTWVDFPNDEAAFNDDQEITFDFVFASSPVVPNVVEDFESGVFPPVSWLVLNHDEADTWDEVSIPVGPDGNPTTCTWIENYFYQTESEEDELVTEPIDLTGIANPVLTFDLAYTPFNDTFSDTLRIDVYKNCGSEFHSTIFFAGGSDLATSNNTGYFEPVTIDDWENLVIDLSALADETILIKFVNINNYGNNIYLDNINILNPIEAPVASFTSDEIEICIGDEVTFQNTSTGFFNEYTWSFGDGASMPTSTGAGPFTVTYNTSGTKTITLDATNPNGNSSITQEITVVDLPEPSFTYSIENEVITFTNTSTNANGYIWDFGDGNASTDINPVHTYSTIGMFNVILIAQSDLCPNQGTSEEINIITTDVDDLGLDFSANVLPNPNQGIFNVRITDFTSRDFEVDLIDMTGRVLQNWLVRSSQGDTVHRIENNALTAGVYFVKIRNENSVKTLKVIVQ